MSDNTFTTYNEKGFLLPDSINSVACYHAKIKPDGVYMFRLHDCNAGAKLIGTVTNDTDIREAIDKLRCLAVAASDFANFIEDTYSPKLFKKEDMKKCTKCGKEIARHNHEICICIDCFNSLSSEEQKQVTDVEF